MLGLARLALAARCPFRTGAAPLLTLLLAASLAGCAAKLPVEKPERVMGMTRVLDVVLESEPAGAEVYEVGELGRLGALLGTTPCVLARLELAKELWKYSDPSPPPAAPPALATLDERVVDRRAERRQTGEGYSQSVLVRLSGYRDEPVSVVLRAEDLPAAFRVGRRVSRIKLTPEER